MQKSILAAFAATVALASWSASAADVPYPEGYRDWRHVKSMVIQEGHPLYDAFGGIHHLYANAKALQGYAKGDFPDGAIIVFDLLEAKTADHAIGEGARKVVGVMHKDSKRWRETGGWGFEGFKGDSKTARAVGANAATACFACHTSEKSNDYVFSKPR
ncbi:MAG TPA: cytochrome P460 family protein [Burkholderiales bacterium]|nr:cytochrome P460 family protein [Burkholderiales bacterium]